MLLFSLFLLSQLHDDILPEYLLGLLLHECLFELLLQSSALLLDSIDGILAVTERTTDVIIFLRVVIDTCIHSSEAWEIAGVVETLATMAEVFPRVEGSSSNALYSILAALDILI